MNITEKLKEMKGHLSLQRISRTGEVIESYEWDNLIVTSGYNAAAQALAGVAGAKINAIALGSNSNNPTLEDTDITNPLSFSFTDIEYFEPAKVKFNFTIDFFEAIGMDIYEWGLITQDGRLFSRIVRPPISKTNEMMLVGSWTINI